MDLLNTKKSTRPRARVHPKNDESSTDQHFAAYYHSAKQSLQATQKLFKKACGRITNKEDPQQISRQIMKHFSMYYKLNLA